MTRQMFKIHGMSKSKEQKIPKNIRNLLAEDETIERGFDLRDCKVFATDRRLFRVEGCSVRDFDYTHISSVEYTSKRYWGWVAFGIVLMIIGAVVGNLVDTAGVTITLLIIGFIISVVGAIAKSEWVEANVIGVPQPIKFQGPRQELDSLLRIIREKRTTKTQITKSEGKGDDIADTIRKLAELRDEGILTQEEFEEKKKNLLQSPD
jgi:hypothetical protein